MSRFRLKTPSPALVVATVALVVALGGTSYAAFKVGTKNIKNGAVTTKKLHKSAVTNSKLANGAVTATKLNTAGVTVPNATNATTAASANSIGTVTYVQGNNVDAPANGGNPYAESDPSIATCPSGTVVVGSGVVTFAPGEEVSELQIAVKAIAPSGPFPGAAANSVIAYIDNFNNTDYPTGNYAEAVCTAAHTVSNPSGLAKASAKHH